MEDSAPDQPAARRSSDGPLVVASVVCFALAGAAAFHFARPPAEAPIKTTGFDAQEVGQAPSSAPSAAPAASASGAYGGYGLGSSPPPMTAIATGLGSLRIGGSQAGSGSARGRVG